MDRRDQLFRFYRQNPSVASRDIYKAQQNHVVWLQRKAKYEYFHQLISRKSHPSAIWNTLKLATSSTSSSSNWSSFNSDSASIANTLNGHFASVSSSSLSPSSASPPIQSPHPPTLSLSPTNSEWCEDVLASLKPRCAAGLDLIPSSALIAARSVICYPLCSILNSSIATSVFPGPWKCASIKPLHKAGECATPSNYRPISLLPVPSKLLEKHVQKQLSVHLNSNKLLFPYQSGFRPSHSTQTLLLHCLDKWYKALDSKKFVGVLFLDISKAFDTVNHDLLLSSQSFSILVFLHPLFLGSSHTSLIVLMLLGLLIPTLHLPFHAQVYHKARSLVLPSSLPSSIIFLLSFLLTLLYSSLMTPLSSSLVMIFLLSTLLFNSLLTWQTCG